jgi:3-phosphoshikimate 1-carboxyvinyltransferase
MTLAVVGLFAKGKTVIRNVYNWRVKETERMVAMVTELTKLGVKVEEVRIRYLRACLDLDDITVHLSWL